MKISMKKANNILAAIGFLGGIIIVVLAFVQKLPFIRRGLPGAGFFPIICGIAIAAISILLLAENYSRAKKAREKEKEGSKPESIVVSSKEIQNFLYTFGASVFVMVATKFIGLLISIGVSVIILIRFLGKENWRNSVIIGLGTTIVLYLVFKEFLGVSLPDSMIGF